MPEIKIKHVVSFSSEDKVYKAENLLKSETYRKWKCASPGEKNASIVLQFEKATQIHSIDIGNEGSAFVEVLVGRSSDSANDYQVLLVASSFMSPIESRNGTNMNRVRMFGAEKLAQNLKEEKWDNVQVVCTQPFNKSVSYGLSFIKFHSPPEEIEEPLPSTSSAKNATVKLGAFKLSNEEEEDSPSLLGSWFEKKNNESKSPFGRKDDSPSYAAKVLAASNNSPKFQQPAKRKHEDSPGSSGTPSAKRDSTIARVNREKVGYRDIFGGGSSPNASQGSSSPKVANSHNPESPKTPVSSKQNPGPSRNKVSGGETSRGSSPSTNRNLNSPKVAESPKIATSNKPKQGSSRDQDKPAKMQADKSKPFAKLMDGVVFVISGFVNPLRGQIRDKALEMGAKYKGDWDSTSTHLVCAFVNTPKYTQVLKQGGKIVTKEWILDCHKKRSLLPWRKYMLGKYSRDSSEEGENTDAEEEATPRKNAVKNRPNVNTDTKGNSPITKKSPPIAKRAAQTSTKQKCPSAFPFVDDDDDDGEEEPKIETKISNKATVNGKVSNQKRPNADESDTSDEEALRDYIADTDAEDSGCDTEGEIRKVEESERRKEKKLSKSKEDIRMSKPETKDLPLPHLLNLFKKRHFFLYGDFASQKRHDLQRYITAYDGVIEDYMSDSVKYVISDQKWDSNFEDALNENEDILFVKSDWIFKCHDAGKLLPYQPYLVTPE